MEDDHDDNELTVNLIQRRLVQSGFDYTLENKCQPLFAERGKRYYTLSTKHTVVTCRYCLKTVEHLRTCLCR
jgi:hypothetical protein